MFKVNLDKSRQYLFSTILVGTATTACRITGSD